MSLISRISILTTFFAAFSLVAHTKTYEIKVAIAAPTGPINITRMKFNMVFTLAPTTVVLAITFEFLTAVKTPPSRPDSEPNTTDIIKKGAYCHIITLSGADLYAIKELTENPMTFLYHTGTQFLYNDLYAALS